MNDLIEESNFRTNWAYLKQRIANACEKCGRSTKDVRILPITKTFPVGAAEYALRAECLAVGENRVQEALIKMEEASPLLQWELVGHLQSNKAKLAAGCFARIQSVDSLKLLRRLNVLMEPKEKCQRVLLQINAGEDPAKFGAHPNDAAALLECALSSSWIKVEGFMTIAPFSSDQEVPRRAFARMRQLSVKLSDGAGVDLPELSMGMTGDLESAVWEGSTLVRVGSGLFGERISH